MSLSLNTGNARAPLKARGDDLYETPAVAVDALLKAESLPKTIWEPACGPGADLERGVAFHEEVAARFRIGQAVIDEIGCVDEMAGLAEHADDGAIVTNPPFKLATEFVEHSIRLCIPKIVMLLRLGFLESERRRTILDSGLLARVYVFRNRLPMMHRAGRGTQVAKTNSSAMAFAWFVWELGHTGSTELHRISWEAIP